MFTLISSCREGKMKEGEGGVVAKGGTGRGKDNVCREREESESERRERERRR